MPKQFEGKTCVLCQVRASSRTGEHVWPLWLLKAFPPGRGYTWWINGEQLLNRDGQPRKQEAVDKVKLPVCSACNSILSRRFEQPAKPLIRSLMDRDGNVVLSGPHAMDVARWFLKTPPGLGNRPPARARRPSLAPVAASGRRRGRFRFPPTRSSQGHGLAEGPNAPLAARRVGECQPPAAVALLRPPWSSCPSSPVGEGGSHLIAASCRLSSCSARSRVSGGAARDRSGREVGRGQRDRAPARPRCHCVSRVVPAGRGARPAATCTSACSTVERQENVSGRASGMSVEPSVAAGHGP